MLYIPTDVHVGYTMKLKGLSIIQFKFLTSELYFKPFPDRLLWDNSTLYWLGDAC